MYKPVQVALVVFYPNYLLDILQCDNCLAEVVQWASLFVFFVLLVFQYTVQQYLLLPLLLIVLNLLFVYQRGSARDVVNSSCSLPPIRLPSLQPVLGSTVKAVVMGRVVFKTYSASATFVDCPRLLHWDRYH